MFPNIGRLSLLRTLNVFIVKKERGHSLAELCDLNLGGLLVIEGLANVASLSEAKEANLKGKKDLQELKLYWDDFDFVNAEEVLEGLQPHSNLKYLTIFGYDGLRLPSWLGDSSALSNLVHLSLVNSGKCELVGALGKLPSMKELHILYMGSIEYIDDECYSDVEMTTLFPSLEELTLQNLERFLKMEGDSFPRLSKLEIRVCPKLDALPEFVLRLTSFRRLRIHCCPILSRRCREEYKQKKAQIFIRPEFPSVNGFLNLLSSITLPSLSQTLNLLTVHRHSLRATPSHTRRRSVFVVASPFLTVRRPSPFLVPSLSSSLTVRSRLRLRRRVSSSLSRLRLRLRLRRRVSVLHRSSSLSVHRSPFARVFIVSQRGKSGLVALNLDIAQVADFVKARLGASESGCIEIEENWDKVKTIFLPTEKPMTLQLIATLSLESIILGSSRQR